MKRKTIGKMKMMLAALLCSCSVVAMSGCSTLFGSSGYMIKSTNVYVDSESGTTYVTINFTDETVTPLVITIPKGISGSNGVGIRDIVSTINDGYVTIVISYTDPSIPNTTITVPVINGEDGKGIAEVSVNKDSVGNTVIVFKYTDGTYSDNIVIPKGENGVGIESITTSVSEDGTKTIITIKYTDHTLDDTVVEITNPVGISSIDYDPSQSTSSQYALKITYSDGSTQTIYVPIPPTTVWHTGEGVPSEDLGKNGDFYLNKVTGYVYQKVLSTWIFVLSMKGTGSSVSYLVSFDANGGQIEVSGNYVPTVQFIIDYGCYIELSKIPTPVYEGYTFKGWMTSISNNANAGQFTDLTPVFKDMQLYAKWE